jgi:hypothetical protein
MDTSVGFKDGGKVDRLLTRFTAKRALEIIFPGFDWVRFGSIG